MTYYAVGNQSLRSGTTHAGKKGIGKEGWRCNLFKACPDMHKLPVTPEAVKKNFLACETFKLFATQKEAEKYRAFLTNPLQVTNSFGQQETIFLSDYPIFSVELRNNDEPKMATHECSDKIKAYKENHTYLEAKKSQIKLVGVSYRQSGNAVTFQFNQTDFDYEQPKRRFC